MLRPMILMVLAIATAASLAAGSGPDSSCSGLQPPVASSEVKEDVFPYRMKGKVRLLFFWVGKDDVGGGAITRTALHDPEGSRDVDGVEVIFGSIPERVPGKINRWGYGREWAFRVGSEGADALQYTVFEGFMRRSAEESLDEVRRNSNQSNGEGFEFEGIVSTVRPEGAQTEMHRFFAEKEFDYRDPHMAECQFQERLEAAAPFKKANLPNASSYNQPFGFLTAVRSVVQRAVAGSGGGERSLKTLKGVSLNYVYNARLHRLDVRGVDYLKSFALDVDDGKGGTEKRSYAKVAEIDFQAGSADSSGGHRFTLIFPLEGPLAGIPLRIVDRPRWWLKVELNLDIPKIGWASPISNAAATLQTDSEPWR